MFEILRPRGAGHSGKRQVNSPVHFPAASATPELCDNKLDLQRGENRLLLVIMKSATLASLAWHYYLIRDGVPLPVCAELIKGHVVVPKPIALCAAAHQIRHRDTERVMWGMADRGRHVTP